MVQKTQADHLAQKLCFFKIYDIHEYFQMDVVSGDWVENTAHATTDSK
jgi:hypothetical protein